MYAAPRQIQRARPLAERMGEYMRKEATSQALEFDDAVQKLFIRHDGGEDTPKGILKAADYPDYDAIADKEAAALMVSLDIFRGVPEGGGFVFGADRLLAKSAFVRMLAAACGRYKKEIFAIERIDAPISVNEAKNMVAGKLGGADSRDLDVFSGPGPLNRETACALLAAALRLSDGSGEMPYLFYVGENRKLQHLRLPENSFVAGPDGMLVTLTVDGVFQPLTGGWDYDGDLALTLTPRYELYRFTGPMGASFMPGGGEIGPNWWNDWSEPYRAALYIQDGEKCAARSIDAAYHEADGQITIVSDGTPTDRYGANDFNGILINGEKPGSKYEIRNLKVRFTGNSRDDFQGMGAALLMVGDETETLVENADIVNYGTVRSSMVVGGSAKVLVKHSRFQTHDGCFEKEYKTGLDSYSGDMRQAPRQGGFEGNCRSTNLLDKSIASYFDSQIMAEKWGVLSTDMNVGVRSVAVNSFIGITGGLNSRVDTSSERSARESLAELPFQEIYGYLERDMGDSPYASSRHPAGYGTYSIGNSMVKFAGSTVVSVDFSAVCANDAASVLYCASTPENLEGEYGFQGLPVEVKPTVAYCRKTGLQIHRGNGKGLARIQDKTLFHCGGPCVVLKSSGAGNFEADDATLVSEMGIVLQMMDEDDVDAPKYIQPAPPTEEDRAAAREMIRSGAVDVFSVRPEWDSTARFANMTVNGDTYNSCGYTGRITQADIDAAAVAENPFPGPSRMGGSKFHCENARNLGLTLENCVYNGAISTAQAYHFDTETGEWLTEVPREKWYCICIVKNEIKPVYQAGIILRLEKGSVWNVPRTCYITSLTVDERSRIAGRVFVDGKLVVPQAGVTYTGMICVEPGK